MFDGLDITGGRRHERVAMGIARTFQITRSSGAERARESAHSGRSGRRHVAAAVVVTHQVRRVMERVDQLLELGT